jgi:hypothetical protein
MQGKVTMPKQTLAGAFGVGAFVMLLGHSTAYAQKGSPTPIPPAQNVTVVNTPSEPVPVRDADNPARQPIQRSFSLTSSFQPEPYTVPDGKRLVIEHVSGEVTSGATCKALYGSVLTSVTTDGTEVASTHRFPLSATPLPNRTVFSQQVRLYADPNTNVRGGAFGHDGTNNCTVDRFSLLISGYLVDVPQAEQQ